MAMSPNHPTVRYERRKSDTPDTAIDIVKKLLRGYFGKKPVDEETRSFGIVRRAVREEFTSMLALEAGAR